MRSLTLGGLDALLTGGTDRQGGGSGPIVVMCHGYGAPGDDLVGLWESIDAPPDTRFLFPAAPLTVGSGFYEGRAWWPIDMARLEYAVQRGELHDLAREVPAGLAAARDELTRFLDAVDRELSPPRVVLGGFSQGAMLSCDVALRTERPLAGLALLSGTLLAEEEWAPRMPKRRSLPVFQSHGTDDPLLPFAVAERLRDMLREAGLEVTWVPFRGGHGIAPGVLARLGTFLQTVLSPAP
jgi:phospholipase/carboxylesterase